MTAGDRSFLCPPPQLLTLEQLQPSAESRLDFVKCLSEVEMCSEGSTSDMYQSFQGEKTVPDPKRTQERLGESGFLDYRSLKTLEGSRLQKTGWSVPHH